MSDRIIRAIADDMNIRVFAISGTDLVEEARRRHGTSPVVTAALGRLLMGGAMMGVMMKGKDDLLTIQIKGDGPVRGLTVTADSQGNVKGYAEEPVVIIPPNYAGKLDVGAAVGYGTLTVIKDLGLKEPYVSQVPLGTSEIAEDLTYYFYTSEQTPTSVALGVLMSGENTVEQAGGFILQLMPGAGEKTAEMLERRLSSLEPVTALMERGMSIEGIVHYVLDGMNPVITDTIPARFKCNCSKEHFARGLVGIGKNELRSIIEEGKPITVNCSFCNQNYTFSVNDIQQIADIL